MTQLTAQVVFQRKALWQIMFLFAAFMTVADTFAQPLPSDSVARERLEYIEQKLNEGRPMAKLWWNGWLYGYSAATLAQGTVYFTSNELKTKQDMALGAATTLVGAIGQLLMPMTPASAPEKLALLPDDTYEQRIAKLNKAEELFLASAQREKEGRSWKMHAISGAVNLTSGMITWLGFKRTVWAGIGNFALNTVITEAQIWTQPTRAIKDYKLYCEMYKNGKPYTLLEPRKHYYVNASTEGIMIRMVF